MRCQLQPMKTKVRLYQLLINQQKSFTSPSLLTRQSALVLKVDVSYVWKMANASPFIAKED